jgi:broad specificity phosphatase PhoE
MPPHSESKLMSKALPLVYLARHGDTEWSVTGQHTGRTVLPLKQLGEDNTRELLDRIKGLDLERVLKEMKIYAESFQDSAHLNTIVAEAEEIVSHALQDSKGQG